jgi:hypothetical protein
MGEIYPGGRRSWRAGADCKSVGKRLWGFESLAAHNTEIDEGEKIPILFVLRQFIPLRKYIKM